MAHSQPPDPVSRAAALRAVAPLHELGELREITVSMAAAVAPVTVLARILNLTTRLAQGNASTLLVTPEQASAIVPSADPSAEGVSLGTSAHLVWRGALADAIRDWEGAADPYLPGDGTRLVLPLTRGGVAVHEPALGILADARQLQVLLMCAGLAGSTVQIASRIAEAEERARLLEQTRHRLREQNLLLRDLAVVDELTGLYNRRFFEGRLAYELERFTRYGHPLALLLIDVDHFKRINDTYGHPVGDEVLRHLARLIPTAIRRVDVFCRYGGEEFVLLMPETPRSGAAQAAMRLRRLVQATPARAGEGAIPITVSAGLACATPGWSGDAEGLVRAADQALYQAKRLGRNRVVVSREEP